MCKGMVGFELLIFRKLWLKGQKEKGGIKECKNLNLKSYSILVLLVSVADQEINPGRGKLFIAHSSEWIEIYKN